MLGIILGSLSPVNDYKERYVFFERHMLTKIIIIFFSVPETHRMDLAIPQ